MSDLSHFDESGAAHLVDVTQKDVTLRLARASAIVVMDPATLRRIRARNLAKGDVLAVARLAGIMAAKQTGNLIPLCHPLGLDAVEIAFRVLDDARLAIEATCQVHGRTGVEMEAMVAVSVASLTIYDMCKSIDRALRIESVQLEEKSGGKSGHFLRDDGTAAPQGENI